MPIEVLNEKLCSLLLILLSSRKELESTSNVSTASGLFFRKMVKIVVSWKSETGVGERVFLGSANTGLKRWKSFLSNRSDYCSNHSPHPTLPCIMYSFVLYCGRTTWLLGFGFSISYSVDAKQPPDVVKIWIQLH